MRHRRALLPAAIVALAVSPAYLAAQLTGYSNHAAFAAAAGPTTLITFEAFAPGTQITDHLAPFGIDAVSGDRGGPVEVFVGSSGALPFPMFVPGTLPSEQNFLSTTMSFPVYATGSITFDFPTAARTAIGAFIADAGPLGDFSIQVFAGALSLGTISVGPRTSPDSFVGVTSLVPFTSARFFANEQDDSWGLDDLEFNGTVTAAPEPGTWALLATGLVPVVGAAVRRRRRTR